MTTRSIKYKGKIIKIRVCMSCGKRIEWVPNERKGRCERCKKLYLKARKKAIAFFTPYIQDKTEFYMDIMIAEDDERIQKTRILAGRVR